MLEFTFFVALVGASIISLWVSVDSWMKKQYFVSGLYFGLIPLMIWGAIT